MTSTPTQAGDPPADDGAGLRWAVKASFFDYVSRLPDGRMSATDGLTQASDGQFFWRAAPDRPTAVSEESGRSLRFVGDLRCTGHGGLLSVRLADPSITIRGDIGTLSVVDTFDQTDGPMLPVVTFEIARRDHAPGIEVMAADTVRLTDQGAAMFNTVYPKGELFEPLTVMWPADRPNEA